jgi:hypothetical protein
MFDVHTFMEIHIPIPLWLVSEELDMLTRMNVNVHSLWRDAKVG